MADGAVDTSYLSKSLDYSNEFETDSDYGGEFSSDEAGVSEAEDKHTVETCVEVTAKKELPLKKEVSSTPTPTRTPTPSGGDGPSAYNLRPRLNSFSWSQLAGVSSPKSKMSNSRNNNSKKYFSSDDE